MIKTLAGGLIAATALALISTVALADPEIVSGPAADPDCFVPWAARNQVLQISEEGRPLSDRAWPTAISPTPGASR